MASIRSSDGPDSPAQSSFSRDGTIDNDVRTLDYLGLAETPQQTRAQLAAPGLESLLAQQAGLQPMLFADLDRWNRNAASRFRSYSVNAKEKYAEDEDEDYGQYSQLPSGTMTPEAASAAAALAATQAQIHQHNLAVQAFANQAAASRPRARTAGILDTPPQRSIRNYLATPSRLAESITTTDLRLGDTTHYDGLPEAVQAMQLGAIPQFHGLEAADENNLDGPTRALWIGSIPVSTTVTSLEAIFGRYGKIESTRVLTHKNCGFVNYEFVDSAIQAKSILNGKELFPGSGPVRIGYAKVPVASANGTPGHNGVQPSPTPEPKAGGAVASAMAKPEERSCSPESINAITAAAAMHVPDLPDLRNEMMRIVREYGATDEDAVTIARTIESAISFQDFATEIPPVPEPNHTRQHDAPRLREIRKRIDNHQICSQVDVEDIAIAMLPEIAELASDYLGNTVVQKLFERCSESVKELMLREIAPYLAQIGTHKNGTWAAQKIIDVAKTPSQMNTIVDSLRPYGVALFLDQFGNYVLQGCLRFGYPYSSFVFEVMLSRLWDVAQGRFGARAMRACLESHHATKDQQRVVGAIVSLHSVQLATNANGALLLTWLLDTCNLPRRCTVLGPRLVPHLTHLCTHKVAYLTVLKVINQQKEPEARDLILKSIFMEDATLEAILSDSQSGATLIYKVLSSPFFNENLRTESVQNVRTVLTRLKASPNQGYKRLMDEVGLSRAAGGPVRTNSHQRETANSRAQSHERQRPMSQAGSANGHSQQQGMDPQFGGQQFFSNVPSQQFNVPSPLARTNSADGSFDQYNLNGANTTMYPQNNISPLNQQQLQYQAFLQAQSRGIQPANFYGPPGFNNYPNAGGALNNFQNNNVSMAGSPAHMNTTSMMPQPQFTPQPFANTPNVGSNMGGNMYQYSSQPFYQQQQQQIPQQGQRGGGSRGRVSHHPSPARNTWTDSSSLQR